MLALTLFILLIFAVVCHVLAPGFYHEASKTLILKSLFVKQSQTIGFLQKIVLGNKSITCFHPHLKSTAQGTVLFSLTGANAFIKIIIT